jgi:CDP-6-deoxy-D-xylo-4-hexulose-3-dehydrase
MLENYAEIHTLINKQALNNKILDSKKGKYWYPLSFPTYDADEIMEALDSMVNFKTTMWEKTTEFEQKFGDKFGGEGIMVNSGSSADLLIAFGLSEKSGGPLPVGAEVLVPSVTWPTQIWSLIMAGFKVKLIDTSTSNLNMCLTDLEKNITNKTKAISIVHLMGNPMNMDKILELCLKHDLILIEDCCESLGSKWSNNFVGSFGLASSFSFFFSHHMTTMEGGMITTKNKGFAENIRLLRAHGWSRNLKNSSNINTLTNDLRYKDIDPRYLFLNWGFNVRPTELQAGFGLRQLEKVDHFEKSRIGNANRFMSKLSRYSDYLSFMNLDAKSYCSWFAIPILINSNSKLISVADLKHFLDFNGVETRPIVTGNIARHPAVEKFRSEIEWGHLPGSDFIHENGFYIGLHPIENDPNIDKLVNLIDQFFEQQYGVII